MENGKGPPLLEVRGLSIEFQDKQFPDRVVSEVNFTLEEGGVLGIVGESGSGKSMTAHAAAGLLSRRDMKKTGRILFRGKDILSCPREELRKLQGADIGMIFQEPMSSLNPVKKIGWQVGETLRIHTKLDRREIRERALTMLGRVGLPERVYGQYPGELSGGMCQRAMIASAMIARPALLIADEPTTALDVTIQSQIITLLQEFNRTEKTAILFISHDLGLVKSLCERVVVMRKGKVVESGLSREVFAHPKEAYTRRLVEAIPRCEPGQSLRERMKRGNHG